MTGKNDVKAALGTQPKSPAICVYGYGLSKSPFLKEARALKAHSEGCSLILAAPVERGQKLLLMNGTGQNPVVGEIVTARNLTTRMLEVEVAFAAPCPDFWLPLQK